MNYYISDTHFGCTNSFENRTLEHDILIKENWNKVVTNADDVYILGDIGKCGGNTNNEYLCSIISTLKGRKHLILGNHDDIKDKRITQLFVEICDYKEIIDNTNGINQSLVLSHYPIFSWNGAYKSNKKQAILLYGHLHNNFDNTVFQDSLRELRKEVLEQDRVLSLPYAYNVGAMMPYMNYCPKTLKQILENN